MQHVNAQQHKQIHDDSLFARHAGLYRHSYEATHPYYVSCWTGPVPSNIKVIRKLSEQVAIVSLKNQSELNELKQKVKITSANSDWKFSPSAEAFFKKEKSGTHQFIVAGDDMQSLLAVLKNNNAITIIQIQETANAILIECNTTLVKKSLLDLKEITFIDVSFKAHAETAIIGYERSFHGLNSIDYNIAGANGRDIVVSVKEQKMDESDLDLYKRVLPSPISASNITSHATVISSIIGGAGNSFYDGRGVANACKFFPSSFSNLFADDASVLNANKVSTQNHSYGTVIQQFYGAEAISYDAQAWANKPLLHVFSSGNQGSSFATDGKYANIAGFANITGNFKMAKNIVTVGAIDNKGNIATESSSGPLYDGRLAPQLIALGPSGTSDAAAIVSGTAAVIQQVYADSNAGILPAASLVKAVLYNTADDINTAGIDFKTGYGLLNSYVAVKNIQQKNYDGGTASNGQQWTKNISIPADAARLKVTLSWTDTTAAVNNNKALINDLDLEVLAVNSGTVYKPWVLSAVSNVDSLSKAPVRRRDSLNTAEQVSIAFPPQGSYQVKVMGTSVLTSSQSFNIAYAIDTLNRFAFTNPQQAQDVNRLEHEQLFVRWRTFVADSNQTGNLYISYDGRATWQLVQNNYKIYRNQYLWTIKDTNSIATFKMETSFGNFFTKDFIISNVIQPIVDFNCADSLRISWNKHIYANTYRIYTLIDSPYLKPIFTVGDTFIVIKKTANASLVYAVEPILSNNLPATRSIAFNIQFQQVKCFYKVLYYDLLDENKAKLILQLTMPQYIDSVFFEKISANGQLLKVYGGFRVENNNLLYNQIADDLTEGVSYFRARIKLKTGAVVITETISVLTSGKKRILFYPNPVNKKQSLGHILQQGIPTSYKLQLFDALGRMTANYLSVPDQIDISRLAPGLIIYKLLNADDTVVETGKIMVMQ